MTDIVDDVPRSLVAKHEAQRRDAATRAAHLATEPARPGPAPDKSGTVRTIHDERRNPIEEVLDVESAHDGTFTRARLFETRDRTLERERQRNTSDPV